MRAVFVCACGGSWRMYRLPLWWESRQAFPSLFPALFYFSLNSPLLYSMARQMREMPVAPDVDWKD